VRLDRAALGGIALALTPGFNVANVGALAEQVGHAYGVGLGVVGLFTTALFLSHAGTQVWMGRLCDRLGPSLVGLAGLLVVALASTAVLAWQVAWFAIAMRFVAGFGTAASFVGGSDYMRAKVGSPIAQGLFGASSMAGGGLALALLPLWPDWRAPFLSAALVAAAGAVVLAVSPRASARRDRPLESPSVADRRLMPIAAWHAGSFGLSVVLGNWVVTLLHRAGGVSEHAAGVAGGLVLFLGLISRPLGGRLIDRPGLVRASFLVSAAGTLALAAAMPFGLAVLGAVAVGLAAGIPFAPAFTGAARLRPDAPGAAVGFVNMVAAVTILVGTPLLGLSFSLPGDGRIGFVAVAALCFATAFVTRPAEARVAPSGRAADSRPRPRSPIARRRAPRP
jgi:MFS transporter, NNP family, nitrate/nitrite transporter